MILSELTRTRFERTLRGITFGTSDRLPSEYAEENLYLTSEVSPMTGRFRYDNTPYLREIVDRLSPYDPARVVAVMKGAQIGLSSSVIINGLIWIIANNPGNILMLSADETLNKEMIDSRLDQAIDAVGIRHLIRPNTKRGRHQRTGDTSKYKEFAGGRLYGGGLQSVNKLGKQRSVKYGFFDDWDAAPVADKEQGSIFELLQQRFASAAQSMKQFYISTPETRPSNIEQVYLMGDQRKWNVPCPLCGEYIEILWNKKDEQGRRVGVIWDTDEAGKLQEETVRYRCQHCGGEFSERHKYEINLRGKWIPTAKPARPGYVSYHISAFVSPPGMYSWTDYAFKWLEIFKHGNESKAKRKVFRNVVEGFPWEERVQPVSGNKLARNTRDYQIGTIPTETSREDGNGDIVMITCACDLNGTLDDARLDWEVVAHAENQTTYSIAHGSIGTYYPGNKNPDRPRYTYRNEKPDNVWDLFYNEVIDIDWPTDEAGRTMRIIATAVDTGYMTTFAYHFIDSYPGQIVGIKGKADDKFLKSGVDLPRFKPARERNNLYILESDLLKDDLAELMVLKWERREGTVQPPGFMNFPEPSGGLYTIPGYFMQYEAEQKVLEQNDDGEVIGWKWVRKHTSAANHFFDVRIYNNAVRDILAVQVCKELKIKGGGWLEFVGLIKNA